MNEQLSIKQAVHEKLNDAIVLSNTLYDTPELAYQEVKSSHEMVELLRKSGFEVEYPFLEKELGYGTAFRAVMKNGDGPSVAFMAEYDALPVIGHGCGHNLHGALSVLCGVAMSSMRQQFSGSVYVIGTPAEEENGAKTTMAQKGVFDRMSLATMIHSWSGGSSQPNMDVLSLRCYVIEFYGQESHAVAAPWKGKSALAAARKFLDLVDARRECFTPDIFVNGIIQEGGKAPNIVPNYSKIRLEFRTGSRANLEQLDTIVRKCAQGAAMALDCSVKFTPGFQDFWDMVRISSLENEVCRLLNLYQEPVCEIQPAAGSSDVGNVSYQCPTIQPMLSITDAPYALHTEQMRDATREQKAYEQMEKGACILIELALRVLKDEKFRTQVIKDFQEEKEKKLVKK